MLARWNVKKSIFKANLIGRIQIIFRAKFNLNKTKKKFKNRKIINLKIVNLIKILNDMFVYIIYI
jgi:hypothetical protein